MQKGALLSLVVAFGTVVGVLVVLELMRRRGYMPVERISDVLMPPAMAPTSLPPPVPAAAAAAAVGATTGAMS
jgi:hypothetical protein